MREFLPIGNDRLTSYHSSGYSVLTLPGKKAELSLVACQVVAAAIIRFILQCCRLKVSSPEACKTSTITTILNAEDYSNLWLDMICN
jgi:hypothetical protein